jgi:PTH1 family peptidyl-tRNA hydrolase
MERELFTPENILIVMDDVNLELGRLRIRRQGSAGGHKGLESVMENLGTDEVPRLRLGVGQVREGGDLVDHVLGHFLAHEEETLQEMLKRAADACEVWMKDGVDAAMNRFNG